MTEHSGAAPGRESDAIVATAPIPAAPVVRDAPEAEWYRIDTDHAAPEQAPNEARLRALASMGLGCSELTLTELRPRVEQVMGCGRFAEYASRIADPNAWAPIEPAVEVAAREMRCDEREVTMAALSATIRTAVGCGRSARYELVCGEDCGWTQTAHAGAWEEGAE